MMKRKATKQEAQEIEREITEQPMGFWKRLRKAVNPERECIVR